MIIVHRIDDILFDLFPKVKAGKQNKEKLIEELKRYYSWGPYKPEVKIKRDYVEVIFNEKLAVLHKERYEYVVKLCDEGRFKKAEREIRQLIKEAPNVSEYHRILGQIKSEIGQQGEGINSLIDALRWDPSNEWALIMMGNILAKYKNDIPSALKYYQKVLDINPQNNIALNNVGANLMKMGKTAEAIHYFNKAIKLNPDYPNTYYALAMINESIGEYNKAFDFVLKAIDKNPKKDDLFNSSMSLAIKIAQVLINSNDGLSIVKAFAAKLEFEYDRKIVVQKDSSIPTAAKIEIAENHGKDVDVVKYKPDYPAVHHLVMHQLVNLYFICQARKEGCSKIFLTNNQNREGFIRSLESHAIQLNKKGFSAEMLSNYYNSLFDGINRQIFNTPIDLFIEEFIYKEYKDLHPHQFLSLLALTQEGIKAVTDKDIIELAPLQVLSKSKIYNLVAAIHFKSLYGVDLINEHDPSQEEWVLAKSLYDEYLSYHVDKIPGIEYELIQSWAEKLKLEKYFLLINEYEYHNSKSNRDKVDKIEKDNTKSPDEDEKRQEKMRAFLDAHSDKDINIAVVMYMVGAMEYFKNLNQSKIKQIAFEIATIGINGINPKSDNYHVPSINDKTFTGYQLLAYYYVSWAIAVPDMLSSLQLPFDKEYELATKLHTNKND